MKLLGQESTRRKNFIERAMGDPNFNDVAVQQLFSFSIKHYAGFFALKMSPRNIVESHREVCNEAMHR
jgi:hypothetical protein